MKKNATGKSVPQKHKALRIAAYCAAALILLLLVAAIVGYGYIHHYLGKIDREEITGNMQLTPEELIGDETVPVTDSAEHIQQAEQEFQEAQQLQRLESDSIENILLIGSDRRSKSEYGRSDSMILLTLNHDTGNIHLTSLMRAMYVCIPRSDGDTWGMLNWSYSWGGPQLLIDTVELNFRIDIDRYVVVDFQSFKNAIDILNGVDIELTSAEASLLFGGGAGTYHLNGEKALMYAQIRYIDNDFVRTGRQRKVLMALLQKASGSDLSSLMAMADEILPMVNTNLTNTEILRNVANALPMLKNPLTQRMLPIENEAGKTYTGKIYVHGSEMYKVDFETNIRALHEFLQS